MICLYKLVLFDLDGGYMGGTRQTKGWVVKSIQNGKTQTKLCKRKFARRDPRWTEAWDSKKFKCIGRLSGQGPHTRKSWLKSQLEWRSLKIALEAESHWGRAEKVDRSLQFLLKDCESSSKQPSRGSIPLRRNRWSHFPLLSLTYFSKLVMKTGRAWACRGWIPWLMNGNKELRFHMRCMDQFWSLSRFQHVGSVHPSQI